MPDHPKIEGGFVASLPAAPHLMTRGATYQHARVKAIALAYGYLHELRAAGRLAPVRRASPLPLAA